MIVWITGLSIGAAVLAGYLRVDASQDRLESQVLNWHVENPFLSLENTPFLEALEEHASASDRALWGVHRADSVQKGSGHGIVSRRKEAWGRFHRRSLFLQTGELALLTIVVLVFPALPIATTWIWLGRKSAKTLSADAS